MSEWVFEGHPDGLWEVESKDLRLSCKQQTQNLSENLLSIKAAKSLDNRAPSMRKISPLRDQNTQFNSTSSTFSQM